MRVLCVNYPYDLTLATPEDLLRRYLTLSGCAEALRAEGAEVTVLQRFHRSAQLQRNGVNYLFHADHFGPRLRTWQIPYSLHGAARRICAGGGAGAGRISVVHANGLIFPLQLRSLRAVLPRECAIVAQNHAEMPWRGVRRHLQKWGLQGADGFFFTATEQAHPWIADKVISAEQPVYPVMEGSTMFRPQDRAAARAHTGLAGSPIVLWVGNFIPRKDPLTVLRGFELILQQAPGARFYMAYAIDEMLPQVRAVIAGSAALTKSVTLLGTLPHDQLEAFYNSADYFVLGSHSEGSGYALAEALACGVVPVVTDIPSFRQMTGEGRIGALWPRGDAPGFAAAFLQVLQRPLGVASGEAVEFFRLHLSFQAIARASLQAYREIAARRAGQRR